MNDEEIIEDIRVNNLADGGVSGLFEFSDVEICMQKARADERQKIINYLEKETERLQSLKGLVEQDYLSGAIHKILDIRLNLRQLAQSEDKK